MSRISPQEVVFPAWWYEMSPMQLRIVATIRRFPFCNSRKIAECVYAGREDGGPETDSNCIQAQICLAKRKGAPIKSLRGTGASGYYLDPHDALPFLESDRAAISDERAAA